MTGTVSFVNDVARFGAVSADLPPHAVEAAEEAGDLRYWFSYVTPGEFAPGDTVTFDIQDPIHHLAVNVVKVVPLILTPTPFIAGSILPGTRKFPVGAL